ncbi:MAG: methionyl-tRNA formyltransferase [Lachnospiraceae bacterium]|nr:methionyl-tRNA formyltransferase [Lachnospiraceae bacterium]
MRIVFMGTPDFAASALKALIEAGEDVVLSVTQPDREKGRGKELSMPEVKKCALEHGVQVFQPEKVREAGAVQRIREAEPEIIVVAAFGQILTKEILDIPKYGCVNIHASLLPEYRGASPIQCCIADGKEKTGVTIMQMDEGLDTGDILMQREIPISADETGGSLFDRLSELGSEMIVEALPLIREGKLTPVKQDDSRATYVGTLKKDSGVLDFSKDAEELERLVRAMDPWPGTFCNYKDKSLKIWKTRVVRENNSNDLPTGTITGVNKEGFTVKCGKDELFIEELQLSGKKRMKTRDFLLGAKISPGEMLK